jgi:type IV pilus assembly protein PilM
VEALRVKFVGRNGSIPALIKAMKDVPKEERPAFGKAVQAWKAEVEAALRLAYEDLMAQIDIGIRYFSSSEDSKPLNKILLGGGGAAAPGLKDFIEERSGIETDTVNPFRLVPCDSKVFGEGGISIALSNIYAPALGLAMRKF